MNELSKIPTSTQIRAARSLIPLTQEGLSKLAGVSLSSVKKFEQLDRAINPIIELRYKTVMQIISCLEELGIEFVTKENLSGVILRMNEGLLKTNDTNPL